MGKKFELIKATDIVPGMVYLAMRDGGWHPCQVFCSEEPGVHRGVTRIEDYRHLASTYTANAFVKFVGTNESKSITVYRKTLDEDWTFGQRHGGATLRNISQEWINTEKASAQRKIQALNQLLDVLNRAEYLSTKI